MDQFFQTLRKIQKKERNNGTLARVVDTFYQDIHKYLNNLKKSAVTIAFGIYHISLKLKSALTRSN